MTIEGVSRSWLELPVSVKKKLVEICEAKSITQKQFFIDAVEKEHKKLKK